jgi:hypothetical protein
MPHPSAKIIDHATFASVPQHLVTFTINKPDDQLVDELRSIWAMHGRLIPTRFAELRALLLQPLSPPIWFPDAAYQFYDVRPESRDPARRKKGNFVRLRSPVSSEMDWAVGHYLAGVYPTSLGVWSWMMRSSILDTNFGVRLFTICRTPGPNSWKRLTPASLPIVEPKALNVVEGDRVQYGR